ncbi:MAG: hypothetical protein MUC48_22235 [Leptolyngbya sp. Prado105]|jgi:hypothetical protein|nr:hypothetical protein [Leptolyngbya sp. Prado105]
MVLSTSQTQTLMLHMLLKQDDAGQTIASIVEMPNYQVIAATKEAAIEQLQAKVRDHLAGLDVVPFEVPMNIKIERENPWLEFIGMYEGDADFAEIAAELRRERGLDNMESMQ